VTRKIGGQTTVFSSYPPQQRGREFYNSVEIWQAARATSAATTFFDSIEILGEEFADGAFRANNPINEMWTEAGDTLVDREREREKELERGLQRKGHQEGWAEREKDRGKGVASDADLRLEDNVGCFVSIGTGKSAFNTMDDSLRGIFETLKGIATDCETVVETFERQRRHILEGRFFRFNVPQGLDTVGLEEVAKRSTIIGATRSYLETNATVRMIRECRLAMRHRQCT
jgi:predicted acylesterase/phospholipase RssA